MKKVFSVIISIVLVFCLVLTAAAAAIRTDTPAYSAHLQFKSDKSFRILQIADIQDGLIMFQIVKDFLRDVVPATKPDLIVLTGDNFSGGSANTGIHTVDLQLVRNGIDQYMSVFEKLGVPVAVVFGNHDAETTVTREEQMQIYSEYDCCIGFDEGEEIYGCGNYNVPIYSSTDSNKIAYNLWMIDSNMYDEVNGGYDYVHQNQIDWYVNASNELKAQNGGTPVPSMMFQHIIVPDIFDALLEVPSGTEGAIEHNGKYYTLNPQTTRAGALHERPCPSKTNSGQFDAVVNQGDVVAMFFGHDHVNSFEVEHRGVDLVATPGVTFFSYGDEGRGARVIDINENDLSTYSTDVVTYKEIYEGNELAELRFFMYGSENNLGERFLAFFKYVVKYFVLTFAK